MFTAEAIHARVKKQPFAPVRIVTSAGETFDICHPHLVMVGKQYLCVGEASEDNPTVFDQYNLVSILDIIAIENVAPPAADANGQ